MHHPPVLYLQRTKGMKKLIHDPIAKIKRTFDETVIHVDKTLSRNAHAKGTPLHRWWTTVELLQKEARDYMTIKSEAGQDTNKSLSLF